MAGVQNGVTFGIEIESSTPTRTFEVSGFNTTHDASVQTPYRVLDIMTGKRAWKFYATEISKQLEGKVVYSTGEGGTEYVSQILDSSENADLGRISNLLYKMQEGGVIIPDNRAGIHIHVSYGNPNIPQMKNLLRLGRFLESAFYLLGGLGQEFRGVDNDAIYCRPITKWGPVCIEKYDGSGGQIYDIEKLIDPKLKGADNFWRLFGDMPFTYDAQGFNRYNPARYQWLNLFTLYPGRNYRGTVEFRIFNLSLSSAHVLWMVDLCTFFIRSAFNTSYNELRDNGFLEENSAYINKGAKDKSLSALYKFLTFFKQRDELFPGERIDNIMQLAEVCKQPLFEEKYVMSHLRVRDRCPSKYWSNYPELATPTIKEKIHKPNFVDVHQLRG